MHNRLDIHYNGRATVVVSTEQEMTKTELQLLGIEALLSDVGLEFSQQPDDDRAKTEERMVARLVEEFGTFLAHATRFSGAADEPLAALAATVSRLLANPEFLSTGRRAGEAAFKQNAPPDDETAIQRFKRYYFDYRRTDDVDASYENAFSALLYAVIERCGSMAEADDSEGIRNLLRELSEIRLLTGGSNDSMKERFESEFRQSGVTSLQ